MQELSDSVCVLLSKQQSALVFDNQATIERNEMKDKVTSVEN